MAVARRNVIRRECALLSRPSGNSELAFDQAILWMARTSPYPSLPLHVGLEGESKRSVRELAPRRFPASHAWVKPLLSRVESRTMKGSLFALACGSKGLRLSPIVVCGRVFEVSCCIVSLLCPVFRFLSEGTSHPSGRGEAETARVLGEEGPDQGRSPGRTDGRAHSR